MANYEDITIFVKNILSFWKILVSFVYSIVISNNAIDWNPHLKGYPTLCYVLKWWCFVKILILYKKKTRLIHIANYENTGLEILTWFGQI